MAPDTRDRGDLERTWRAYFEEHHADDVERLAAEYPAERSLYVDVVELHTHDPAFANAVLSAPDRYLRAARRALSGVNEAIERANVRIENHPGLLSLPEIRSRHVGEVVTVEGVATESGPVGSTVAEAVFVCGRCGHGVRGYPTPTDRRTPQWCGECEARGTFELSMDRSRLVDVQRVGLVAPADEDGTRELDVYLDDDLVGTVSPDDGLLVTGVVRLDRRGDSNCYEFYVEANAVRDEYAGDRGEEDVAGALQDAIEERWQFVVDG